ncbi:MAG: YbaY family lipoprotein [Cephaloticoccus sp.]|nr:YbaY family lipoprotein [Akkermansiaceae bacterium]MCF7760096.1 YbaY family lipoprotein [Cephaloticoccus sp.]
MKTLPALLFWAGMSLFVAGCSHDGGPAHALRPTMTGTVNFKARLTLPPTAALTVRLLDKTKADAPAVVLAERSISNPGNPPIAFALPYPFGGITATRRYVIDARIEVEGRLQFYSMETHEVTPQNAALPHEVWVDLTKDN